MARETQNVIAVECNCYHDFEFSKWVNILCDEQMKSIWVYVYQSTEVFEDALLDEGIQLANYFPDGICLSGGKSQVLHKLRYSLQAPQAINTVASVTID
jgi:hypothetical protein